MKFLIQIIISAISVLVTGYLLPGIKIDGFSTALVVAVVLAILNVFLKPVLVLFSIPATIFTLGLFLLVINAVIILIASKMVDGFHVSGFWSALFFSIVLSVINAILGGWGTEDWLKNHKIIRSKTLNPFDLQDIQRGFHLFIILHSDTPIQFET